MRSPEGESYVPAFEMGKPLVNFAIVEVLKSNNSGFSVGQKLYGHSNFEEYVTLGEQQLKGMKVIENKEGLPWSNVSLTISHLGAEADLLPSRSGSEPQVCQARYFSVMAPLAPS